MSYLGNKPIGGITVPANSVESGDIQDGAVTTAKVNDAAITAAKMAATLDLSGKTVDFPPITGLQETSVAIAAAEIDLSAGNYFTKTVSADITFTVANVASSGTVSAFVLELTNGGAYTVTYFSGVTWAAATPPTLTASGVDTLAFFTHDGGTTWRGFVLGLGMASA